jgi:hypothetical protein
MRLYVSFNALTFSYFIMDQSTDWLQSETRIVLFMGSLSEVHKIKTHLDHVCLAAITLRVSFLLLTAARMKMAFFCDVAPFEKERPKVLNDNWKCRQIQLQRIRMGQQAKKYTLRR